MNALRRVVLDVLKPHEPGILDFARGVSDVDGVDGVNVALIEMDQEVKNIRLTVEGESLSYDRIEDEVEALGATVHSVDEVVCGDRMVEDIGPARG